MANNITCRNSLIGAAAIGLGLTVVKFVKQNKVADMRGQVVLITGGSRGLGLLLSHEFAHHGAKLVVCARKGEELAHARQELDPVPGPSRDWSDIQAEKAKQMLHNHSLQVLHKKRLSNTMRYKISIK